MTEQPPTAEYRIEDLAHISGATVRTIRAYQDRGLLPRPERRGRANVYSDAHLARLRQIADLLDRGYTLASIKELLEAWDAGRDLGGVLGLVAEVDGPWTDEEASRISRADLDAAFGGAPDDAAVAEAIALGVLERVPDSDDEFHVPSPQELAVAAELHSAGVPLKAIAGHLREVRGQVEHIASRFLDFTTEHVFQPFLDHPPTEAETVEAAALVRRLRPLAQQTVDAELARAMRTLAARYLRHHLAEALPSDFRAPSDFRSPSDAAGWTQPAGWGQPAWAQAAAGTSAHPPVEPAPLSRMAAPESGTTDPADDGTTASGPVDGGPTAVGRAGAARGVDTAPGAEGDQQPHTEEVSLPDATVRAVQDLVGPENTAAFIAAAAHREVQARTMDALAKAARDTSTRDDEEGGGGPQA
ncbi:MerR family transcriptional regulator [Streptomyces sp. NPDC093589]|uniref:MerR family transcriptional regulator n=1 Tax=Streptomyces sp. NPDC093589 TaxID=3366043 RepID=UPI0037F6A2F8